MSKTFIDEKDVEERLSNIDNLCNLLGVSVRHANSRLSTHKTDYSSAMMPESVRVLVGGIARVEGTGAVQREFGTSRETASRAEKGLVGTKRADPELMQKVDAVEEKIIGDVKKKASQILMESLNSIRPDELENAKLREKTGAAKDMATVLEKLSEKGGDPRALIQFNILVPRERKESDYDAVEVG